MTSTRRLNFVSTAATGAILGLYLTTVHYAVWPLVGTSQKALFHLAVLTYTTAMAFMLFLRCVYSNPGRVPKDWMPDTEANGSILPVKRTTGRWRFCQKCQAFKPPRCHHCRICRTCILRMDHHCVWMNNCIGHGNYRAFISFLIFLSASLIHHTCLLASYQHHLIKDLKNEGIVTRPSWMSSLQIMELLGSAIMSVVILGFLLRHLSLISTNKTTIESHEGVHAKLRPSNRRRSRRHPYDLGALLNFDALFGRALWKWFCFYASTEGDGLQYPTRTRPTQCD